MRTIFLKSGRFLLGVALAMPSLLLAAPPTQYEVQKLLASDGSEESWFGFDVVMRGDTAAISATNAAYVFTRGATGQWSEQPKLVPSDRAAWNWCVSVVAISNDTIRLPERLQDVPPARTLPAVRQALPRTPPAPTPGTDDRPANTRVP